MVTDYPDLTKVRLQQILAHHLRPGIHSDRAPVDVSCAPAPGGEYRPIAAGERWGAPWSTTWFRVRAQVPQGRWALLVDLGYQGGPGFTCEALAWRNGLAWRGVNPMHPDLPVDPGPLEVLLEAAANPRATVGGPGRAPSMIKARQSEEPAFRLGRVELARVEPDVWALYLDFKVLLQLALALPDADPRAGLMLASLNRCANALDLADLRGTAAAARNELAPALACRSGDAAHRVTATGHSHLDTAWLWPLREARRKAARTFATAAELLEEYPDHRFAASQPQHYAWVKEDHPELFERIRALVAEGRWEVVGGMWVEADCTIPSGESLVRQYLHGKRFYREEFGADPLETWLPDVFGYPGSLPQVMTGAGCTRFLTQKLSWNQFNRLPHSTFWWEGIDGTRVLAHCPPTDTYNGTFELAELLDGVRRHRDHGRSPRSLYLFGWGDGGGGPTAEQVETARRLRDLDGAPRVELGTAGSFFEAAQADGAALATWSGELYFELHRGTYTSQSRTKRLHRQAETALRSAELWAAAGAAEYPRRELDRAWKTLLVNEFHDILPGSSIDWVYEDAERQLGEVIETADRLARASFPGGRHPVVLNAAGHARREVFQGRVVEVPACGWAPLSGPAEGEVIAAAGRLENSRLSVSWDAEGRLVSVFDKEAGREVLAGAGNVLLLHPDHPNVWDAWDLDPHYQEQVEEIETPAEPAIVEPGGVRGAVRFRRRFRASTLEQTMVLESGSRVLRFETEVDWQEERRVLRVAFPVAVRSPVATYEIQFGHVQRPTHRNTSWDVARFEVPAQRWADLGEAGYGVALLNDSKYGYDVLGNAMRLTLLRAPLHPDPGADRGRQRFTYALMPHPGDFRSAGVIQAAEALNVPLRLAEVAQPSRRSVVGVDTPQVVISAVKRAEDSDALIVRLYEAWGGRCEARLRCSLPFARAALTDLLEAELHDVAVQDGEVVLGFDPFKILTVKLE